MKIQLLLPAGEIHRNATGIFKRSLRYSPLTLTTLTTLAALVPEELNPEVTIQDEGVDPLNLDFEADVESGSCLSSVASRAAKSRAASTWRPAPKFRRRSEALVPQGLTHLATLLRHDLNQYPQGNSNPRLSRERAMS